MPTSSRSVRRALVAATGLAVAATGVALVPLSSASAASAGLVISEVYGGGGNSGATLKNDFIELYNPTGAAISVDGMSVQYRSSTNTGTGVTALSGSVPAGGHYLVQEAAGTGGTVDLPTPDAEGNLAMSGTNGIAFLAQGTAAITLTSATTNGVVDLVGYGSASISEGTAAGVLSNTTSASRTQADSDNNAADFTVGDPNPQSSGGTTPPDPDEPTEATIAEIQGTDTDTSPLVGVEVETEGVVTAAYPTGGYNGFYIQTPGSPDTPGASDAVFVYGSAATAKVEIGDSVEVIGDVSEYNGTTEITPDAADVTVLDTSLGDVGALDAPWSDLDTAAEKESHEGELVMPQGDFTVTDNYDTNYYASFTLASGDEPLVQPTDVADAQDADAIAAIVADNAARAITLDDGASINFNSTANKSIPLPWLSTANPVRIGSAVTFHEPLVLEYRNSLWNLQPTSQVTGSGSDVATFSNTRTAAPEEVGGDVTLATFNVLNYFPTTGADYVSAGLGTCTYYNDRAGNPITVNSCGDSGPRGAANDENLERQQTKIVTAINDLDASIVSLEEIENSVKFGLDRDYGVSTLVDALNAAVGSDVWAYAPSPDAAGLPPVADQDVIRTAFIYKPADVELVGGSQVLTDAPAFDNAREPLAQGFKAAGAPDSDAFAVIVNHFKSKGSGEDDGTGQGNANPDRIAQAEALSTFADSFASGLGTDKVFLTGDFNSYTQEDPLQVLYDDGYTNLSSTTDPDETTYSFDGLAGSLDHVLASPAAEEMVTGVDIWNINADEAIAFEYSRYNYNATLFYEPGPYRASDHDPELVGLDLPDVVTPPEPKSTSKTTAVAKPSKVYQGKTRAKVTVTVRSEGAAAKGKVEVRIGGKTYRATLKNGKATVRLAKFGSAGVKVGKAVYLGNDTTKKSTDVFKVKVTKKKRR